MSLAVMAGLFACLAETEDARKLACKVDAQFAILRDKTHLVDHGADRLEGLIPGFGVLEQGGQDSNLAAVQFRQIGVDQGQGIVRGASSR